MSQIILQPCSNKLAYDHFRDTVERPVKLSRVNQFLTTAQRRKLQELYPEGRCYVWGVEAKKGGNIREWNKIVPGDLALFAKDMAFMCSGVVTLTLQNADLALELWEDNGEGGTWEYIYFLKDINPLDIPLREYNGLMGHKPNYPVRGFRVLDEIDSQSVLEFLQFDKVLYEDRPGTGKRQASIKKLENLDKTEKNSVRKSRLEQQLLTDILHDGKTENTCSICGKLFPVPFLVTAHIKIRAYCSPQERKDYNVVMPLCRMGCDELYERGYVGVVDRKVVKRNGKHTSEAITSYITNIEGLECSYFNDHTTAYFQWHYDHHSRRKHRKNNRISGAKKR